MDGSAFDHLTKTLTLAGSRRRVLGGLLAGALDQLGRAPEGARAHDPSKKCKKKSGKQKKKCLKKAKKHNAQHASQSPTRGSDPGPDPTPQVQVFESPGTFMFTTSVAGTLRIEAYGAGGGAWGSWGQRHRWLFSDPGRRGW
jgi:hypothetical protein